MTGPGASFVASLNILVSFYALKYKVQDELASFPRNPKSLNLPIAETYDFIVVGAGTAGGTVASLLSNNYSVLLVEAGGNPPPIYSVPRAGVYINGLKETSFMYNSAKQLNAGLQNGGIIPVTTGKFLGGCSGHNDMIWERGSPLDYDRWAKVSGDESWKYKNILKYFKKLENYHGPFKNDQHGKNGPVDIQEDSFAPGLDFWLKAGHELGFKIRDPNGPQTIAFSPMVYSKKRGRRVSTFTAFIQPALKRNKNRLKISRYSFVSKILFKKKRAIGVEYLKHGVPRVAFASKEVILSAGTFSSPVILIKSGIGPKEQVTLAKVRQLVDLPVGSNLIDHPKVDFGPFFLDDPNLSWSAVNLTYRQIRDFVNKGKGPLGASSQSMEAHIVSRTRSQNPTDMHKPEWSDLQISYSPIEGELGGVTCIIGNSRPLSKGKLTVNFTATHENYLPILDLKYYTNQIDLEITVDGIEFCLRVIEQTKTFQSIGGRFGGGSYKACMSHTFRSRDYWRCYVKYHTRTGYHSVGTCRMGKVKGDPLAVVDSKLRVIGIDRLRVVDASIMPYITNANTAAPTWMIGMKIATEILQKYHRNPK